MELAINAQQALIYLKFQQFQQSAKFVMQNEHSAWVGLKLDPNLGTGEVQISVKTFKYVLSKLLVCKSFN